MLIGIKFVTLSFFVFVKNTVKLLFAGCPPKKVSIKNFNSDLLITLIQTSLDPVGL